MNIVIVGPGAIGSLWAYKLTQAGHNVSLWSRKEQNSLSLQLDALDPVRLPNRDPDQLRHADLVVITTKAWQVAAAIAPLLPLMSEETILLFMHNGMGAVDELPDETDRFPLLLATTTHGALKTDAETVLHTGKGITQLGAVNDKGRQCRFLEDVLQHALPEVAWNDKIEDALWLKLAINCAINPLTALNQCRNGELNQPGYQEQLNRIIDEIVLVANAEGHPQEPDKLSALIHQVISATAANYSSMHQDIYYNRKTEIDYITGYLLKRAQTHGLSLPENQTLYQRIKALEPPRSSR